MQGERLGQAGEHQCSRVPGFVTPPTPGEMEPSWERQGGGPPERGWCLWVELAGNPTMPRARSSALVEKFKLDISREESQQLIVKYDLKNNGKFAYCDFIQSCVLLLKAKETSLMRRMRIQNADKMVGVPACSPGGLEPRNPHWAAQEDLDSQDPRLRKNAPLELWIPRPWTFHSLTTGRSGQEKVATRSVRAVCQAVCLQVG